MIGILIVEDEHIVAMALEKALRGMGYVVTGITDSGEGAIEKSKQSHPDLVLMDIRLKGEMDGIEAAEEIQRRMDIPVVYLSAYGDDQTLQRAAITAAYGYILKPFEERDVRIAIEMALYKHMTEQKLRDRERCLTATLNLVGEAVIVVNEALSVMLLNPSAAKLTGWTEARAVGKGLAEVLCLQDEEGTVITPQRVKEVFARREPVAVKPSLLEKRRGGLVRVDGSMAPILDHLGRWRGMVVVLRDQKPSTNGSNE